MEKIPLARITKRLLVQMQCSHGLRNCKQLLKKSTVRTAGTTDLLEIEENCLLLPVLD